MGILEHEARRTRRNKNVQRAVLLTVGAVGIIAVAAMAPNALQLLGYGRKKGKFTYQAKTAAGRLAEKGYIVFVESGGKKYIRITPLGERALMLVQGQMQSRRKRRWDKRWRLVIFDVPEYRRRIRDKLRRQMSSFGFVRLQNSVWVYPYDCEELVALLKADLHIGKDVLYVIVEKIENDLQIRKLFGLSR